MKFTIFLYFLATVLSTSHAKSHEFNPIRLLRPSSAISGHHVQGLNCLSWRLAVETSNLQGWQLVPESCEDYMENYMLGEQYSRDCEVVADTAIEYAENLTIAGDGKDIWVFDIDETALSNLPYFARSDVRFGTLPPFDGKFFEWLAEGRAPAVPAVLRLYKKLLSLGFKTVFLTGAYAQLYDIRAANLLEVGYSNWEKLILRGEADLGKSAVEYKSERRTELVKEGYRVVGNVGDQWSDLIGANAGNRTFKVPNPMYYAA